MPEFLAPGLNVEEIERGPRLIEGVPTSTAALLGETERGPTRPRLVTSVSEYLRCFGGSAGEDKYLPDAIRGFFENGGRRAFVCRIVGAGARAAALAAGALRIEAVGPGAWGNRLFVKLGAGTKPGRFRLHVAYWQSLPAAGFPADPFAQSGDPASPTAVEEFRDIAFDDPASPDYYARMMDGASSLIRIAPAGPFADIAEIPLSTLDGGADGAHPGRL